MLTVITHTMGSRPELLKKCVTSVETALAEIPNSRHLIIDCKEYWHKARIKSFEVDEYIAFVDDDDTVEPTAIKLCMEAFNKFDAGIAFTGEEAIDCTGRIIQTSKNPIEKTYDRISKSPRTIHHLSIFNSSKVDIDLSLSLHNQIGFGIDWYLKASAALKYGAAFIPIVGYKWLLHNDQMTSTHYAQYDRNITNITQLINKNFGIRTGQIPYLL